MQAIPPEKFVWAARGCASDPGKLVSFPGAPNAKRHLRAGPSLGRCMVSGNKRTLPFGDALSRPHCISRAKYVIASGIRRPVMSLSCPQEARRHGRVVRVDGTRGPSARRSCLSPATTDNGALEPPVMRSDQKRHAVRNLEYYGLAPVFLAHDSSHHSPGHHPWLGTFF